MRRKLHFSNECFKRWRNRREMQAHHTHTLSRKLYSLGCKFRQRRKKIKKNRQSAKTQRVDPPKFTTRMPKTSLRKKDGDALIFPAEFFTVRSSSISRHCQRHETQFYGNETVMNHVSDSRSPVISYPRLENCFNRVENAS